MKIFLPYGGRFMRRIILVIGLFIFTIVSCDKTFAQGLSPMTKSTPLPAQVTELFESCKSGQIEKIRELVKQGADVNLAAWERNGSYYAQAPSLNRPMPSGYTVPSSRTPLLVAIFAGHLDVVKELIKAGADVNKGNSRKETPLMFASKNGQLKIVKTLLSAGADVNAKSASYSDSTGPRSYTALYFASKGGHLSIVKTLLAAGAKVNISGTESPLAAAASGGYLEIVKELQKAGAATSTVTHNRGCSGNDALAQAVGSGNVEVVKALIAGGANVNGAGCDHTPILKHAIFSKNIEIIKVLVKAGADVNRKSTDGVTGKNCSAMELAYEIGNQEIIKILQGAGGKVDPKNTSALLEASAHGQVEAVKELIAAGVDVNIQAAPPRWLGSMGKCEVPMYSMTGQTALQKAAENGRLEIVKILLAAGAEIDMKNAIGETALMLAGRWGQVAIAKELLKAGADANAQNNCGDTALTIAKKAHQEAIVKILPNTGTQNPSQAQTQTSGDVVSIIQISPDGPTPKDNMDLIRASAKNDVEKVKSLLAAGADVNAATERSEVTALMYASSKGHVETIRALIAAHAQLEQRNKYGHTALMYASTYNQAEALKELLKAGADVNAADHPGRMALKFATEKGYTEIVKILLNAGADVRGVRKNYAVTALQTAKRMGNTEIMELLQQAGAKE